MSACFVQVALQPCSQYRHVHACWCRKALLPQLYRLLSAVSRALMVVTRVGRAIGDFLCQ